MLLIIVHRLLQSLLLPPLNALLFIILGLILTWWGKLLSRGLVIFGVLLLYIQSTPFVAYQLTKLVEIPPVTKAELKKSQAIVVLGGGIKNTGYEYPIDAVSNSSTLVRLRYAAYLAHQYPTKLIVTSGGFTGRRYSEASVMRDTLINTFGVKNLILIENKSRNTDENAKFVAQILQPMHINNVIIVTQAFHARRATALFKKYGMNAIAAPTDYSSNTDALTPQLAFVPTASAMQTTSMLLHEILGYLLYIDFG